MADGRKIEDKRCLVDVERGRTVPNWCARRAACAFCCGCCAPAHVPLRPAWSCCS